MRQQQITTLGTRIPVLVSNTVPSPLKTAPFFPVPLNGLLHPNMANCEDIIYLARAPIPEQHGGSRPSLALADCGHRPWVLGTGINNKQWIQEAFGEQIRETCR